MSYTNTLVLLFCCFTMLDGIILHTCDHSIHPAYIEVQNKKFRPNLFELAHKTLNCNGERKLTLTSKIKLTNDPSSNFSVRAILSNKTIHYVINQFSKGNSPDILHIFQNGTMAVENENYDSTEYYTVEKYCISKLTTEKLEFRICPKVIIQKCCPENQSFDGFSEKCSSDHLPWFPSLYQNARIGGYKSGSKDIEFNYREVTCASRHLWYNGYNNISFRILSNGDTQYLDTAEEQWFTIDADSICIDKAVKVNESEYYIKTNTDEEEHVLMFCATFEDNRILYEMIPLSISSIFLLITLVVYKCILPKGNQSFNIHQSILHCLLLSMFFMFSSTAIIMFIGRKRSFEVQLKESNLEKIGCISIGAFAHFAWIATFSWLLTFNYDLWKTLRSTTLDRQKRFKRFVYLSAISWGVPLVVVVTSVVMDKQYPHEEYGEYITVPRYGHQFCFVNQDAVGPYLHYVIGILFVLNIPFIVSTFATICHHNATTEAVMSARNNNKKEKFLLMIKLFIVMGISWCFEIGSWWATPKNEEVSLPWLILTMVNYCKGIFIFMIFVWKKQLKNHLTEKYLVLKEKFSRPSTKDVST